MLFVLLAVSASPIAAEVESLLQTCEIGIDLASGDPAEVPAQREACRAAAEDLHDAIGVAVTAAAPYQDRVLSAWRVFDAAIALRGGAGMDWTGGVVQHAANDVRRLRYEVAQQAAFEAQP